MFNRLAKDEDYKVIFDNPSGRRELKHLMKIGYISTPLDSGDPHENAKRAGMQHMVLSIIRAVYGKEPDPIDELIEETFEDERRSRNSSGATSTPINQ